MKKEEIYVVIDNDEKRDKAIKILTDAGEAIWDSGNAIEYIYGAKYLAIDTDDMEWYTIFSDGIEDLTEISLDQLEELLRKEKADTQSKVEETSQFKKVTDSLSSLLEYKNNLYGDAVLSPLQIFSGKCKAGVRLDDKLSRIKTSENLRKNDVSDLMGYLVLTCIENGWDNFDEFKD